MISMCVVLTKTIIERWVNNIRNYSNCQLSDFLREAELINWNRYAWIWIYIYSDLFLLSKLVNASRTPCPRVIRLEWSCEMDDNLKFVTIQIRLHNSIKIFVIVYLDWCNKIRKQHRMLFRCCRSETLREQLAFIIQRKQIRHLFDVHDGIADSTIKYKIKALCVISIYIYHIFTCKRKSHQ